MLKTSRILFLILSLSLILLQCQCGDGPTEPPKDTTRPTIIYVSPNHNATDVSIADSVLIHFSEKLASSSVDSQSVFVSNVNSVITFADTLVILKFQSDLDYNTTYTINLTTFIKDLAGNSLISDTSFSFTTEVDPETLPPTIISTYPNNGAIIGNVDDSVSILFSKLIDSTTFSNSTFFNTDGRTGTLSYNALTKTASFKPSVPFAYDSSYTFSATAGIKDTAGNNLQTPLTWTFNTPTVTPQVSLANPISDSLIIGDTISLTSIAVNPVGIDSMQFFVNGSRVGVVTDNMSSGIGTLFYDASLLAIGTQHTVYTVAFDSLDNFGHSDTLIFFHLWQLVHTEGNEGASPLDIPNDLRKMFVRSTDSTLELRYEYGYDWEYAYGPDSSICKRLNVCGSDSSYGACADTAVDLGIYIDVDRNINTGRRDGGGDTLNDIGAEYRIILGLHGGDNAFSSWSSQWNVIYDTSGLFNHNVPQNTNVMEIGILWEDIGSPSAINIVNVNVFFPSFCDPNSFIPDFMPDRSTNDHVTVYRQSRYIGPQTVSNFKRVQSSKLQSTQTLNQYLNPFE